jgi:hypothetical protein
LAQTLGTAVPRAHLALITSPSTTDGVNCGPHCCAESCSASSRHRRALYREPVGGSRHKRGVRWPLTEVGPTPVPRACWPSSRHRADKRTRGWLLCRELGQQALSTDPVWAASQPICAES